MMTGRHKLLLLECECYLEFKKINGLINRGDGKSKNYVFIVNVNPLSAKFIKWSNTLKQIVGKLPTICLSVFDHFSGLALKGLRNEYKKVKATYFFHI